MVSIRFATDKTLHALFEEQVAKTPNHIAIVFQDTALTYTELNQKANQLANYITSQKPDTLIVLCLDRSLEMIIGILAILKANAAYVPIDPEYPEDRIKFILEDTKAKLILTQSHFANKITAINETIQQIHLDKMPYQKEKTINPVHHANQNNLAYVIYTSGTTGKPKGVLQLHGNVDRLFKATENDYHFTDQDVWTLFHSIAFDFSVWELWGALLYGGKLIIPNHETTRDTEAFYALCDTEKVTILNQTPLAFYQFITIALSKARKLTHLRSVIFGGDALDIERLKPWWERYGEKHPQLVNMYGITETTVHVTYKALSTKDIGYGSNIGKPIADLTAYILDAHLNPVPTHTSGELYIGGAGLARGYLNRPELTAERFIPNPFATEEDKQNGYTRLYKTGDLAQWLPDGNIEYLGRNDFQVKIRGFRIELGEIENVLSQYSSIKESVVLAKEKAGNKYLVAYYVSEIPLDASLIETHLKSHLPDYMVPHFYVHLNKLPLTINGKLDRSALPDPEFTKTENYVAPRDELEAELCLIWQDILKIDRISITDDFFKIGGNSIFAIQITHRMSELLKKHISVALLFRHKTIAALLEATVHQTETIVIPQYKGNKAPLSFAQERLWFIEQYSKGKNAYHIPMLFKLHAQVNLSAVKMSLQAIIQRHEILRTVFREDESGGDYQLVLNDQANITEITLTKSDFKKRLHTDIYASFNLKVHYPIRLVLYRIEEDYFLLINIHHIAFDGWSTFIFQKEFDFYYQHFTKQSTLLLPDLPIQYKDFAVWQREYLTGERLNQQLTFWSQQLSGYETLALLTDKPRPSEIDYQGEEYSFKIDLNLSQSLRSLAKAEGVTLYTVLLSAFYILLNRYTQQDDLIIGTPSANRHYAAIENLVGFFVNSLPIRTHIKSDETLKAFIARLHGDLTEIQLHQDIPFEKLVEHLKVERDTSRHPLFQVMFGVQGFQILSSVWTPIAEMDYKLAKFDISLFIDDQEDVLQGHLNYATMLFLPDTIERFAQHYIQVLKVLAESLAQIVIKNIQVLSQAEYRYLIYDLNKTKKNYPQDKTLHALFEEQVERTPNATAVIFENQSLTYQELNQKVNQLAHYITPQKPDTLIALCVERSLDMIIGILAILKSGAAYVPIDPEYPEDRIKFILEDTQTKLILTQSHLSDKITKINHTIKQIHLDKIPYQKENTKNLSHQTKQNSNNLAYVIYTSGTTGKPKGVMIEHRSVINVLTVMQAVYDIPNCKRIAAYTHYVFDVSVSEFFTSLLFGGELHILNNKERQDVNQLSIYLNEKHIEAIYLPPVVLKLLPVVEYPTLKTIIFAGEPCDQATGRVWCERVKLYNYYGPTEVTIYATGRKVSARNVNEIGKPIANDSAYILDASLQPVPIGASGELYIGGAGLARGYLNRPELTKERFIPNPFATEEDKQNGYTRLYKTGDLARWLPDGNIEYLGRNDFQVKIRGFRIELPEIEAVLSNYPGIKQNVVLAKEKAGNKYLVAYYVSETSIDTLLIETYLKQSLPDYMVPSFYVHLTVFPLTINGKLDRKALPDPEFISQDEYTAPRDELETELCLIWQDLLKIDRIGITDNFFKIGGNSILAIQAIHRMSKALNKQLSIADLFRYKTIETLLEAITHTHDNTTIDINGRANEMISRQYEMIVIPKQQGDKAPLSFAQERLWFIEQYTGGTHAYHIPMLLALDPRIEIDVVKKSLQAIINRHEILRTVFRQDEEGIDYQLVLNDPAVIKEYQLTQEIFKKQLHADINSIFNLKTDYPIRIVIYTVEQAHYLLVNIHHIAFDGWSSIILLKELDLYYHSFTKNIKPLLPDLPIQYKDFAVWQKQYLTGQPLEEQLSYWQSVLSGYETLALMTDKPRPAEIDYEGDDYFFKLEATLSKRLRDLSKSQGVTLYTVLLSAFYILLNRYTHQDDIVIGTPMANRHYSEIENLIGFFINSLALRMQLNKKDTIETLIQKTHEQLTNAQLHQDIPFEKLVEYLKVERDLSRHPIFQVMFSVQGFKTPSTLFKPIAQEDYKIAKFDLSLFIDDSLDTLSCEVNYRTSLFNKETIERLSKHYIHVLQQIIKDQKQMIENIHAITKEEYQHLIYDLNKTDKPYPKDKTLHELFEEQVIKTPNNIAVVYQDQSLTYQELNQKANQLAHYITPQKPDTLIALCVERSLDMIIGILAILKSGAAYVPIDPEYPEDRIKFILEDTKTNLILTQSHLSNKITKINHTIKQIHLDKIPYQKENTKNLSHQTKQNSNSLAYVIYTSGTTGKPKGVMTEHQNFVAFLTGSINQYIKQKPLVCLSLTNYIFDIFGLEYGLTLLSGGKILLSTITDYESTLKQHNDINLIQQTPSVWEELISHIDLLNKTCVFLVGGESCHTTLLKKMLVKGHAVINVYGPTETTVWSSAYHIQPSIIRPTIIGKPLANEKYYVLTQNLNPSPINTSGELYIGGAGLARGYLNRPELTAERFIPNPFATEEDKQNGYTRLYKTGDLVRLLPDGNIEYLGRNDFQVKIRGFRIELGEIENVLSQYPGISQCVVLLKGKMQHHYLAGYYVSTAPIESNALVHHMKQFVPEYMIPQQWIHLLALPLTANGKLDRRALPSPDFISTVEYVAPRDALESALCEIWQTVLSVKRVGIQDDFFNLGGNSILALRLIALIKKQLNVEVKIADLFAERTIEHLRVVLHQSYRAIVELNQDRHQQKTLWMIHPGDAGCEVYHEQAAHLVEQYHCYGVDNYNLYHDKKIDNLHNLAQQYLAAIKAQQKNVQHYYLLGWSLGGQIALEIAGILETEGVRDITVYLLDTFLPDDTLREYRQQITPTDRQQDLARDPLRAHREESYVRKVEAAHAAQERIINTDLSVHLYHTKVILFKAEKTEPPLNPRIDQITHYLSTLQDNNVKQCCDHFIVQPMYYTHSKMLSMDYRKLF